jgi:hypothetical protein
MLSPHSSATEAGLNTENCEDNMPEKSESTERRKKNMEKLKMDGADGSGRRKSLSNEEENISSDIEEDGLSEESKELLSDVHKVTELKFSLNKNAFLLSYFFGFVCVLFWGIVDK